MSYIYISLAVKQFSEGGTPKYDQQHVFRQENGPR